jgi:hypothetical protein
LEQLQKPDRWIALFATLADAEAALHALQAAGVPYPALQLGAHTAAELEQLTPSEREQLADINAPARFWSIAITMEPQWRDKALAALRERRPFALGNLPTLDNWRDDTERGAIAWRHYVFETSAATDAVGEHAGETGTTGIISSGVFAEGALAEGNPPARALAVGDQRQSDADTPPTGDTMRPKVSKDRSRPETELTDR